PAIRRTEPADEPGHVAQQRHQGGHTWIVTEETGAHPARAFAWPAAARGHAGPADTKRCARVERAVQAAARPCAQRLAARSPQIITPGFRKAAEAVSRA